MEAFILAGGQSKRFGEDKTLFKLGGKSVVEHIILTVKKVCPEVHLVVKDREKFKGLQVSILEDILPFQSPIAGLYTALKKTNGDKVLLLSGDMPLLKEGIIRLLIQKFREPVTLFEVGGKIHPFPGIYSVRTVHHLEEYINTGGRSLMGFLERVGFNVLKEEEALKVDPNLDSFINMNTKEDLKLVVERMR